MLPLAPCCTCSPLLPPPALAAQWLLPPAHKHKLWAHPGWTDASPAGHSTQRTA
jgi:hypothetical protein